MGQDSLKALAYKALRRDKPRDASETTTPEAVRQTALEKLPVVSPAVSPGSMRKSVRQPLPNSALAHSAESRASVGVEGHKGELSHVSNARVETVRQTRPEPTAGPQPEPPPAPDIPTPQRNRATVQPESPPRIVVDVRINDHPSAWFTVLGRPGQRFDSIRDELAVQYGGRLVQVRQHVSQTKVEYERIRRKPD